MSAQAAALSGKSSLLGEVLEASKNSQPEESLQDSWARLQKSETTQCVGVSYQQSKVEDRDVAKQDARLATHGLGVEFVDASVGRRLIARRAFKEGSCVFKIEPYAQALLPRCRERRCAHCFVEIEEGQRKRCGGCGHVLYCGAACQKQDWKRHHRRECDGGPALAFALDNDEPAISDAFLACRAARRMRKVTKRSSIDETRAVEDVKLLIKFDAGDADARATAISRHCLAADWCCEQDVELVASLIKAGARNNFCRQDEVLSEVAALLSPVGALLNHSCYPTTCVAYDTTGHQCFIACRDISEGDELTHAYVDGGVVTEVRRERIRSCYGFECACERCTAPWAARDALLDGDCEGKPVDPRCLALNEQLRREAHGSDGAAEAELLDKALKALESCARTHVSRVQTQHQRAECALGSEKYAEALELFAEVAELRERVYAPLPHARVALDYFTLYDIATWTGDTATARTARDRAAWHLERTAAPDDRRLEDLRVTDAINENATADLTEGMIGFSVDDGGRWEEPPEDDDVWAAERGSE